MFYIRLQVNKVEDLSIVSHDWKIRGEKIVSTEILQEEEGKYIHLGRKLENVTHEEENCTGVKYYPGILARTTEQFTCTSLQLGEETNTPPKLSRLGIHHKQLEVGTDQENV